MAALNLEFTFMPRDGLSFSSESFPVIIHDLWTFEKMFHYQPSKLIVEFSAAFFSIVALAHYFSNDTADSSAFMSFK
jgi:hypothetical protein